MSGLLAKAFVVFHKELLVLVRDRRLIIGVTLTSLIVFPALMGLLGNIDSLTEGETSSVGVVISRSDTLLSEALAEVDGILPYTDAFLAQRTLDTQIQIIVGDGQFEIRADRTNPSAWDAAQRIEAALRTVRTREVERTLVRRGLSPEILTPFHVRLEDVSSAGSRGALLLAALLPYLLIVLLVANASRATYIAVGEKEKRTLASLLVCNVPRPAIVLGKSLAIMSFALFASALLVMGMIAFARMGFSVGSEALGSLSFRLSARQALQLMTNVGGLALFISGIIMALGTLARSQREAGIYTSPVLFISIFLAVFSYSNADFGLWVYGVPVLGNALTIRNTVLGTAHWLEIGFSAAINVLLFVGLTGVSTAMYRRDSVLFRQ